MLVCVFLQFCTRDGRCSAHPAFPAPSVIKGTRNSGKPRAKKPRRDRKAMSANEAVSNLNPGCHRPRRRTIQYSRAVSIRSIGRGILDTPLEPVIGLAEG